MTEDALSFLDETPAPEIQADAPAAPAVEPEPQADKGETTATPPVAQEHAKDVPLTALLDERDKRQQAAREADELRRELAAIRQAQQKPAPQVDILDDPEGFARQQQQMVQTAIMQDRFDRSRYMAEQTLGEDGLSKLVDFFNDPQHAPKSYEFLRHPDPFGAAQRYYTEQKEIAEIKGAGGVAAMRSQLEAEIRAQVLAEVQSGVSRPATPPPSLSSAAASGAAKAPPMNGFDAAFGT